MIIAKVYDANVYINDVSTHGMASEVTCPSITAVMNDYNSLGMIGSTEFFAGFDKMEASIKWKHLENDIKTTLADFTKSVNIMVRSSRQEIDAEGVQREVPIVIMMRGFSKQYPGDSFKKGESSELESVIAVNYYKETVDGEDLVEIDVLSNVYKVNGEDLLAQHRQNLGI